MESCFGAESNAAFGMLSHNHLLLLLLCWANSAKWELNEREQGILGKALNAEGRLDVDTAVAAYDNFAELKNLSFRACWLRCCHGKLMSKSQELAL